jgi:hypothetical protein
MRATSSRTGATLSALFIALSLCVSACGGSSKKEATKGGASSSTTTSSATTTAVTNTASTSETATSAPGSPDPYGPNSPTSTSGLSRILVKNGYAKASEAKCVADGLLKELSPPEVQAIAEKKAQKELQVKIDNVARSCRAGTPSGG